MEAFRKIYSVLKKGSDLAERLINIISATLVFTCFLAVFFQVINRYILVKQTLFHWDSITWTDELSRFLLVGITYFTLGQIYKYGQMSRADIVYAQMKPMPKKVLYFIECAMIAIFIIVTIKYSFAFAQANSIYRSEMLRIPGNILYLLPAVGCILVSYEIITEMCGVIAGEIEPFDSLAHTDEITD